MTDNDTDLWSAKVPGSGSMIATAPDPHYFCDRCGRDLWRRSKRLNNPRRAPDIHITLGNEQLCRRCYYASAGIK